MRPRVKRVHFVMYSVMKLFFKFLSTMKFNKYYMHRIWKNLNSMFHVALVWSWRRYEVCKFFIASSILKKEFVKKIFFLRNRSNEFHLPSIFCGSQHVENFFSASPIRSFNLDFVCSALATSPNKIMYSDTLPTPWNVHVGLR